MVEQLPLDLAKISTWPNSGVRSPRSQLQGPRHPDGGAAAPEPGQDRHLFKLRSSEPQVDGKDAPPRLQGPPHQVPHPVAEEPDPGQDQKTGTGASTNLPLPNPPLIVFISSSGGALYLLFSLAGLLAG